MTNRSAIEQGADVRQARAARGDFGGRAPEEVKHLREAAAERAAVCADCFAPLSPTASVTQVSRVVEHVPASYTPLGQYIPAYDERLIVPICLSCWLEDIATPWWMPLRGVPGRANDQPVEHLRRHRCEGCGRPMRVAARHLTLRGRCCCAACLHKVTLRRANERRRVRHREIACEVCGGMFVPKQSTARTCSNRCRQRRFRDRHRTRTRP